MKETWRGVAGYEDVYQVSATGEVKALARVDRFNKPWPERILKQWKHGRQGEYRAVALCRQGRVKHFQVHRLVAQAFLPNPEGKEQVNHRDGNPSNNEVGNLEWATNRENNLHAYRVLGRVAGMKGKVGSASRRALPVWFGQHRYASSVEAAAALGITRRYVRLLAHARAVFRGHEVRYGA